MSELKRLMGLRRIRAVANYQFGGEVGEKLFPNEVELSFSPKTGRVRHIRLGGVLLATLRPADGLLALTVEGARRLLKVLPPPRMRVVVDAALSKLVAEGRDVQAKWVKSADVEIRPGDEVLVVDPQANLLAVGRAVLPGWEMLSFKAGLAVKVRKGVKVEKT